MKLDTITTKMDNLYLDGFQVCNASGQNRDPRDNEIAAEIARRCNVHDELLAALEAIVSDDNNRTEPITLGQMAKARAAIAKAKGKS